MSLYSIDPDLHTVVEAVFRQMPDPAALTNLSIVPGVYGGYAGPAVARHGKTVRPRYALHLVPSVAVTTAAAADAAWQGQACPGVSGSRCFPHGQLSPELLVIEESGTTNVCELRLVKGELYLLARVPYTTAGAQGHPMVDVVVHIVQQSGAPVLHLVTMYPIAPVPAPFHHLCFFRAEHGLEPTGTVTPGHHEWAVLDEVTLDYDTGRTYQQVLDDCARLRCVNTDRVTLHPAVVDAMRHTWTRSGESQSVVGLCNDTPGICPSAHRGLHPTSDAAHFDDLSRMGLRVVELAGLWGKDLSAISPQSARAGTSVQAVPTHAPGLGLSFVGIRDGDSREAHLGREQTRRVEAFVGTAVWKNLAIEATPDTDYRLFKRRFFEASFHRQWGTEATITWLQGLAAFCRDRSGELVGIGDVSHIVGEDITDHGSHERGVDVDIYGVEAPAAGSRFPRAYWTEIRGGEVAFRELGQPDPDDDTPAYGTSNTVAVTGADADRVKALWVTMLAYCAATHSLISAVVWHGARRLRNEAQAAAERAWDETEAAGEGGSVGVGWKESWGPGPATKADINARSGDFIGDGSGSYGSGQAWPLHQDHIHVRFR